MTACNVARPAVKSLTLMTTQRKKRKTTMFDEQPDGDPHGECAAEIHRLEAENAALREWIEECRDTVLYPVAHENTDIGKRAAILGAGTVALLTPND